ncbi:MAG TPA: hypothetical protein P5121_19890, partial [Caldilineaceae bacterium]|nr:hypothetical protein [Caldilineaceae bacterium]
MHKRQRSAQVSGFLLSLVFGLLLGGLFPSYRVATAHSQTNERGATAIAQQFGNDVVATARRQRLTNLVDQAEMVVRGHVAETRSVWRAAERQIETIVTIDVRYTLLGASPTTLQVHTAGGFLADRGIGMVSMHAATFVPNEEVLLFLYQQDEQRNQGRRGAMATSTLANGQWQLVAGAAGKFVVRGNEAINQDGMIVETVDTLLNTVATLAMTRQASTDPLTMLLQHAATSTQHETVPVHTMEGQTEKRRWATPHAGVNYYININTDQVDEHKVGKESSMLRNAITAAAARWSTVDSADFTLRYGGPTTATSTGYNGVSEVLFMHKGHKERAAAAEVWYTKDLTVVEADIWINDDFRWDASGMPAFNEVDLESALIHEF